MSMTAPAVQRLDSAVEQRTVEQGAVEQGAVEQKALRSRAKWSKAKWSNLKAQLSNSGAKRGGAILHQSELCIFSKVVAAHINCLSVIASSN